MRMSFVSMLLPFAIHLLELTENYIFPDNPDGQPCFVLDGPGPPVVTISYLAFLQCCLLPKIGVLIVDYMIVRNSFV